MEILFLAHRAPFPPDRGDRIRSYNILNYLAKRAGVHLVAFVDDDSEVTPEHRALVDECVLIRRTKSQARAAVEALAQGKPVSLTAFADRRIAATVKDILARRPIDAIYAFSGQMAQYLPAMGPRAIMDFVDLDSAKFEAYADDSRGPMRWMMRREARLLAAHEGTVANRVAASLFVSAPEAALLPGSRAVENGIDTIFYDPQMTTPEKTRHPLIVFTGQMDYRPNVDAVIWFAQAVLPLLPDAHFAIVGRAPTSAVRALASASVTVTGEVADVRGWLAAADVVVAPLQLARGVQNKVLEAMAMARPVVASAAAAEGIDHAGTIRIAIDAKGYASTIKQLFADPAGASALGAAARRQVIARYGWDARLAPLNVLLGLSA
ncbi:TIGR03087 family PEP-CTERM/XrtA system glycosyltransferase [Sphingomonas jeddahensis]|uniref:Glycosyl transferases group 1 n=1 Tax=Sphingomonas jeddahensis TaxID=1915074 RepID=A0A1V2ESS7_9SPHN|nr:TIGR03087 family PEP-CTERM/XrtA system glycosyltransferase [Sphingomonas jeddahensis]ONF95234.1 Glycosyl transferases group 1 [Sphingomonas jeddahensis]